MNLLLDTHIWIWLLGGSDKLEASLRKKLEEEQSQLWLSPISIWEALLLGEKKRVNQSPDPVSWARRSLELIPVREASLNREIAIRCREINLPHNDPADRFIAATALVYDLTLVTLDRNLMKLKGLKTLSQ